MEQNNEPQQAEAPAANEHELDAGADQQGAAPTIDAAEQATEIATQINNVVDETADAAAQAAQVMEKGATIVEKIVHDVVAVEHAISTALRRIHLPKVGWVEVSHPAPQKPEDNAQ